MMFTRSMADNGTEFFSLEDSDIHRKGIICTAKKVKVNRNNVVLTRYEGCIVMDFTRAKYLSYLL